MLPRYGNTDFFDEEFWLGWLDNNNPKNSHVQAPQDWHWFLHSHASWTNDKISAFLASTDTVDPDPDSSTTDPDDDSGGYAQVAATFVFCVAFAMIYQ